LDFQLGLIFDRGPNWIHTSGHNPLLQLAKDTNTPLHIWNEKIRVFDRNGTTIPEDKAKELSDLRWSLIEEAFPYSIKNKDSIPASDSLYDFLLQKTGEVELLSKDRQLLLDMSHMWGCYIGDSIQRQSLRFAFLEDCCGGGS
jgi:Flavin containing amine oxidoreductase